MQEHEETLPGLGEIIPRQEETIPVHGEIVLGLIELIPGLEETIPGQVELIPGQVEIVLRHPGKAFATRALPARVAKPGGLTKSGFNPVSTL